MTYFQSVFFYAPLTEASVSVARLNNAFQTSMPHRSYYALDSEFTSWLFVLFCTCLFCYLMCILFGVPACQLLTQARSYVFSLTDWTAPPSAHVRRTSLSGSDRKRRPRTRTPSWTKTGTSPRSGTRRSCAPGA